MKITDFCFIGHVNMGPTIISKVIAKGVENPYNCNGMSSNLVYYILYDSNKKIYTLGENGIESAFGKHILSTRNQITVDEYQKFLKQLSETFLPEKEETKSNRLKLSPQKEQKFIDLVKMGDYPDEQIADMLGMTKAQVKNKKCYLRKRGVIGDSQTKKLNKDAVEERKENIKVGSEPTAQVLNSVAVGAEKMRAEKVRVATTLAAAILAVETDMPDAQLAERAVNITNEILKLI